MNKDSFSFIIYMIHACANYWKYSPSEIYKKMKSTDCIMGFLVPNYEILHTQSTQYIMEDIKTLQTILGHSNIGITMNLYVHTTEDEKQTL